MSDNNKPVARLVFRTKEKNDEGKYDRYTVMSFWRNTYDWGERIGASPKFEADDYGISIQDALERAAKKEGFMDLVVEEDLEADF